MNAANPALIDHVDLGIQAELVPGQTAYNPLLWVGGVPCWPSTPDFSQLEDGAEMQAAGVDFESSQKTWPEDPITLQSGTDFDILILGMPVGTQQFPQNPKTPKQIKFYFIIEITNILISLFLDRINLQMFYPSITKSFTN